MAAQASFNGIEARLFFKRWTRAMASLMSSRSMDLTILYIKYEITDKNKNKEAA
jgi:hypothetical protein